LLRENSLLIFLLFSLVLPHCARFLLCSIFFSFYLTLLAETPSKAISANLEGKIVNRSRADGKITLPKHVAFVQGTTSKVWVAENDDEVSLCIYKDPRKKIDFEVLFSLPFSALSLDIL
jgi:hypothetical protein